MRHLISPFGMLAYQLLVILTVAIRTLRLVSRRQSAPFLEGTEADGGQGDVQVTDIIVPVRNEAANIAQCLGSLMALRGNVGQIIIVDDHSEDETLPRARLLADDEPRLRLLSAPELPPGWTGKNFALHQGVAWARSEWLLFIDADVHLSPDAVRVAVGYAERHGIDLLSLSPRQECGGMWERLLQPMIFETLNARYDLRTVNDPDSPLAAANGQFLLVRRQAYRRIGGHEAVRGEVLEDVALAKRAKGHRLRIYFANTRGLARTRMYRGFVDLWRGWSKNIFRLLGSRSSAVIGVVLQQLLLWVVPFVAFGLTLGEVHARAAEWVAPAIAGAASCTGLLMLQGIRMTIDGVSPSAAVMAPVGRLLFLGIVVTSWYHHVVMRRVRWKGRTYQIGQDMLKRPRS